jgi:hypothetical protein
MVKSVIGSLGNLRNRNIQSFGRCWELKRSQCFLKKEESGFEKIKKKRVIEKEMGMIGKELW